MQWDLGIEALGLMAVMAVGFGAVAGLIAGGGARDRLRAALIGTVLSYLFGLFTCEVGFGWATAVELQPNIDGLSFDEVLLIGFGFAVLVGLVLRRLGHRGQHARRRHRLTLTSRHHPAR